MSKIINRVVVFHGYAGGPEKMWFPWLHRELEEIGIAVNIPTMPGPLRPEYDRWIKVAMPMAATWDSQTLIIAHSLGGVLALRALEKHARNRVAGVILVSVPFTSLINVKQLVEFFDKPIDWRSLHDLAKSYVVLHAKDDPLVPHDHALRYAEVLGADVRIFPKGGHHNAKTFPLLLKIIKEDF